MATPARDLHVVLGSGPAGSTLAGELARRGHPVRLVDRRGDGPALDGVERRAADASETGDVRAVIAGAAAVYHCVNVGYDLQVEVMPGIQAAILAAAEAEGPRLVVLDTLYPYGETHGAVMTEETPWRATTAKGRMRAQLDERYLEAHTTGRVSVALGRSADFYGPAVIGSTLGAGVFPGALTGGDVLALGDIDLPHSYTYIRDVAAGLATLGEQPGAEGRVWHLPTVPATTTRHVLEMVEERVGRPLQLVTLDEPRPFGPFDERFMSAYAEMFYQHREPQIMDSSTFERTFDAHPTPLGQGLDATVAWYREWLGQG